MIRLISNQTFIEGITPDIESCSIEDMLQEISLMPIVGVDTETNGFDPFNNRLLTIQIGNRDVQYVIDFECIRFRKDMIVRLNRILQEIGRAHV